MIDLLLLLASATPTPADAVALCKPALARKAGADIATIDVGDSHRVGDRMTIAGRLTAYLQMGPAPEGSARTHHLGRVDYSYSCEVRRGRVHKARLNPFRP